MLTLYGNQANILLLVNDTIDTMEINMRGYVLWEAQSRQAYGRFTVVLRVLRNWQDRKDLKRLLAMDDYMLKDMGLTREVLLQLSRLPLTADVMWERERLGR